MRRSVKYGLYGLVIAGVLGGTAAWASAPTDKSVDLQVDGQSQQVHTTASNVAGALERGRRLASARTTWSRRT